MSALVMAVWAAALAGAQPAPASAPAPAAATADKPAPAAQTDDAPKADADKPDADKPEADKDAGKDPEKDTVSDVVVTAERPAVVSRIDRQIYDVRKDPEAQSSSVEDILGKVPSVTVTPSGGILLLGKPGARVLVDGKPQSIRALRGADIERIEVITNPSAEYGPAGAAGIINIITRKDRRQGLTGTMSASVDDRGGGNAGVSPTWVRGPWTFSGSLNVFSQSNESESRSRRRLNDPLVGVVNSDQTGRSDYGSDFTSTQASVTYRPDDHHRFKVGGWLYGGPSNSIYRTRTTADAALYDYSSRLVGRGDFNGFGVDADYDWTGAAPDETLALSWSLSQYDSDYTGLSTDVFTDPGIATRRYRSINDQRQAEYELKADAKKPFGADRLLTGGLVWTRKDETLERGYEDLTGANPGRDYALTIEGVRDVWAGYVTFQSAWGKWTVLPGLRVEAEHFDVTSAGQGGATDDLFWYPSLHVSRELTDNLKMTVSYSRRIERPDLERLDPALRSTGPETATQGNPGLDPVQIDAYEARFDYSKGGFGAGLTLYSRESSGTFAWTTTVLPDGVRLSTTVNSGESADRGAELALRGKVAEKWQYSVTTNLFWQEQQVLVGGAPRTDSRFTYSGNAQFSWKRVPSKPETGDQVQLSLRYLGPQSSYQGDNDGFFRADLSWRRPLTKKLTGILAINDLFDSSRRNSRLRTPDLDQSSTNYTPGPTVRFSLTYRLGAE